MLEPSYDWAFPKLPEELVAPLSVSSPSEVILIQVRRNGRLNNLVQKRRMTGATHIKRLTLPGKLKIGKPLWRLVPMRWVAMRPRMLLS